MQGSYLVLGLGTFGLRVAMLLYQRGANVLAVDRDEQIINAIKGRVTKAVACDARDIDSLRAVGALDLESAVVAIRGDFGTTVLVTYMLQREKFRQIMVQVDSEQEAEAITAVGATEVIFPEYDIADRIARKLVHPDLADQILPLGEDLSLVEAPVPEKFIGQTLHDLGLRRKFGVTVLAIKMANSDEARREKMIVPPPPDRPFAANDRLIMLGMLDELERFSRAQGIEFHSAVR